MKKSGDIPGDLSSTDPSAIEAVIARLEAGQLSQADARLISRLLRLLLKLLEVVQYKNASIKRLKRMLFGSSSDKRIPQATGKQEKEEERASSDTEKKRAADATREQKRRGHGRMDASSYRGATVVACQHSRLKPGDACPSSPCSGHLYDINSPSILIRLTGQPLVGAARYEQQVLRCSACQQRYTAALPAGVKPQKYDETCDVAIVLAKYGAGIPFHRLSRFQEAFGVPLPGSVQFARCEKIADAVLPIYLHLRSLAACGRVLYGDDTRVKILSCLRESKQLAGVERKGLQTTGIVAQVEQHQIVLYRSGRQHAGENLAELLRLRPAELTTPIQMGDALARNWSKEFEVIVAKCLSHARRQFIDIEAAFPAACKRVLDDLGKVYGAEAETRALSAKERLQHHQLKSAPVMEELREWIEKQFKERGVEPNSGLGKALKYLQKHWEGLTRFLSVEGAPLDNNLCERALRLAVLNRKNSLFYRTENGAAIGDLLMSLIETCRLNGVSSWDYLLALSRHARQVRKNPAHWLPWNYLAEMGRDQRAA